MKLNLNESEYPESAQQAFDAGSGPGFVMSTGRGQALVLVADNIRPLKEKGIYETALVFAYTGCRMNNNNWSIAALDMLFGFADREKLRAAGNPLPDGDRFNVYRGVSGTRPRRRVRSYSWTLDYDKAAWFARRLFLPDPAVYLATIERADVLTFIDDSEQEIICRPRSCRRVASIETVAA